MCHLKKDKQSNNGGRVINFNTIIGGSSSNNNNTAQAYSNAYVVNNNTQSTEKAGIDYSTTGNAGQLSTAGNVLARQSSQKAAQSNNDIFSNYQPVNVQWQAPKEDKGKQEILADSYEQIDSGQFFVDQKKEAGGIATTVVTAAKYIDQNLDPQFHELRAQGVPREFIIRGENLKAISDTSLRVGQYQIEGSLILTNYKLIFVATDELRFKRFFERQEFGIIPLGMIHKFERIVEKKGIQYTYLDIACKDGRGYRFKYAPELSNSSYDMQMKIAQFAFPEDVRRLFAYVNAEKALEDTHTGWNTYDICKEFNRQQLPIMSIEDSNSQYERQQLPFRYLDNSGGNICSTYPRLLVVPTKMNNDEVIKCSKFRSRERLPVLTYGFKKRSSPFFTTLWRCAQCKPGVSQNRSSDDELMLRIIGCLEQNASIVRTVKIYDARPYLNAVGQQITGKGYEMRQYYKNCEIEFLNIHNIHKVRDSYKKITAASASASSTDYLKELEKSEWLLHLSSILEGARQVVESLQNEVNVVIHCSDGWDRTAQLIALAQLCIDPYFRTIEGFQVLIEKDWVSFGHMFGNRSGHASKNHADENRSPIFVQFLDSVFQLIEQFPLSFEFNSKYLADIAFHVYSNRFGTFLHNSYQEQVHYGAFNSTTSLWSYLASQKDLYENPFYVSIEESNIAVIIPDGHVRRLTVWKDHFLIYQPGCSDPYRIYNNCNFPEDNRSQLKRITQMRYEQYRQENKSLNKRIEELEARLSQSQQDYNALALSKGLDQPAESTTSVGPSKLSLNPMMMLKGKHTNGTTTTKTTILQQSKANPKMDQTLTEIVEAVAEDTQIPISATDNQLILPSLSNLPSRVDQPDLLATDELNSIDLSKIEGTEPIIESTFTPAATPCKNEDFSCSNAALDEAYVEEESSSSLFAGEMMSGTADMDTLPSRILPSKINDFDISNIHITNPLEKSDDQSQQIS